MFGLCDFGPLHPWHLSQKQGQRPQGAFICMEAIESLGASC